MRDSFLYEMRMQFALGRPHRVTKPKADLHARMAERWCKMARDCGRPGYHEASGFTPDRWMLRDPSPTHTRSICGAEKPYGPFSRTHWRYIWLAMREAFLSGWHEAIGTTYETTEGGRNRHAILTGITA
jgi:hypothetical protein